MEEDSDVKVKSEGNNEETVLTDENGNKRIARKRRKSDGSIDEAEAANMEKKRKKSSHAMIKKENVDPEEVEISCDNYDPRRQLHVKLLEKITKVPESIPPEDNDFDEPTTAKVEPVEIITSSKSSAQFIQSESQPVTEFMQPFTGTVIPDEHPAILLASLVKKSEKKKRKK